MRFIPTRTINKIHLDSVLAMWDDVSDGGTVQVSRLTFYDLSLSHNCRIARSCSWSLQDSKTLYGILLISRTSKMNLTIISIFFALLLEVNFHKVIAKVPTSF